MVVGRISEAPSASFGAASKTAEGAALFRPTPLVKGQAVPFFDLFSRGEAEADDIDDYVDRWHEGADEHARVMTLHDYLGLTKAEYNRWVQAPSSLPDILAERGALPPG